MTPRQLEVLRTYALTGSQKETAARLGIGMNTVKNHLTDAYLDLDADGAIDAFRAAGWLMVPSGDETADLMETLRRAQGALSVAVDALATHGPAPQSATASGASSMPRHDAARDYLERTA